MICAILLIVHVVTIALIVKLAYIQVERVGGTWNRFFDHLHDNLGGPLIIIPVFAQIICVVFWTYELLENTKISQKYRKWLNTPL